MNRKENAVKRAVVLFRALMIPALLLGWQGTAMNVQAAEEAPETQEEAQAAVPVEETQALEQPDAAEAAVPPEIGTENADAEVIASAEAEVGQATETQVTDVAEAEQVPEQPLSVTMVGDSILVGSTPAVLGMLPDCVIDAKVGRQFVQAWPILDTLEAQGLLRQTVVMELGTNGPFSVEKGQEMINRLGSGRTIYWVTVYGRELGWQEESNAAIRQLAAANENVHIIDWSQAVAAHPEWLCGDGIHPNAAGRNAFAGIVMEGLQ